MTIRIQRKPDMPQFAENALRTVTTLKEVIYDAPYGIWRRHAIAGDGASTSRDSRNIDEEAWARVV